MNEEVPEGAAVFPPIPAELGVHPQLLAVLHAIVFIAGSDPTIVNSAAGEEALEQIAAYIQRSTPKQRAKFMNGIEAILQFAKENQWPKQLREFLKSFPKEFGIEAAE